MCCTVQGLSLLLEHVCVLLTSPSHVCGTSLQYSRQSVPLSPVSLCPSLQDLSLLTILGHSVTTSTISTGQPKSPQTESFTGSGFKAPTYLICPGKSSDHEPPLPGPNTHINTMEMVNMFCIWSNSRFLEPWSGVITDHPFLIPFQDRVTVKIRQPTTLRLGTPPASSSGSLKPPFLSPSSLCLPWAGNIHIHPHKHGQHRHMHVYTHVLGMGTQMQMGNTDISGAEDAHVQLCWRWRQ